MKNILLLEEEQELRDSLRKIIEELAGEMEEEIRVFAFEKEEDAYACINIITMDVFLVDIVLHPERQNDDSGIRFISRIRSMSQYFYTPVLYVTPVPHPLQNIYAHLHCYAYIEKPFLEEYVKEKLQDVLRMSLGKSAKNYYYIKKDGIIYVIKFSDFVYAKANKRDLDIVKRDGKQLTIRYMPLKKLRTLLCDADIIQCSRSVIVNKQYIDYIDEENNTICLLGGRGEVDIGLSYQKIFKQIK